MDNIKDVDIATIEKFFNQGSNSLFETFDELMQIETFDELMQNMLKKYSISNTKFVKTFLHFFVPFNKRPNQKMCENIKHMVEKLVEYYSINIHINNEQLLSIALRTNYLPVMTYLIERGANIDICLEKHGDLHYIIQRGYENSLKIIFENGRNIKRSTILPLAIIFKQPALAEYSIKNGYEITNDMFMEAVSRQLLSVIELMIECGTIDVNYQNSKAILLAIGSRHEAMLKLLLNNGGKVPSMKFPENNTNVVIYKILKEYGVDETEITNLMIMKREDFLGMV